MPFKDPDTKRRYQARWYAVRREEWPIAQGGKCVDCGRTWGLQVDHVDPRLKVTHRVWSWARERREAELSKCVPRCKACHKKKTKQDYASGLITRVPAYA